MLPESKNIQTIADNIRTLENQINALDVEIPPHASTDAGKVLSVDSDGDLEWRDETPYIPPAYSSTEEVNTGQKWTDGKDIFMKSFSGNMGTGESSVNIATSLSVDNIVNMTGCLTLDYRKYPLNFYINSATRFYASYDTQTNTVIVGGATAFANCDFTITVYYTKPDPEPSTETKSKKGGTKK